MSFISVKSIEELINKGGIYSDIHGTSVEDIYSQVCRRIQLPEGISSNDLYQSLIARENIMCTAIGHGFAIPHPLDYLFSKSEEKIVVVTTKENLNMNSLDYENVYVLFFIFVHDKETLLHIASLLTMLFRDDTLLSVFNHKVNENYIKKIINQCLYKKLR